MDNKIKFIKSRNLINSNEKSKIKRPFSIEKIAKSINCGNLINSIKYKYIDPKIKRKKEKINLSNRKSKRIQDKLDEEMYSGRKIKYHKYKERKESIVNSLSFREPRRSNILLKKQKSDFILPLIIQNKKINESYNEAKVEDNNFILTSGMISRKRLNKLKKKKMTISALYNIIKNKNELMENEYRSFDNIYNINEKYNLNLNLKEKNNNSYINKNRVQRKLTKNGLLAYLFHKYSTVNNNKGYNPKKQEEKVDIDDISSNVSFDLGKDDNNNNKSSQTFLTKLKINNDNLDISKIMNRHNYLIWSIKKNNHKIIDKDKNIYINCLLSKVESELNRDKILYKNNGKTIYELDKEFSYKRLKRFENIVNKFIEKDKSYIFSKKNYIE